MEKKTTKKDEEVYSITFKGLLSTLTEDYEKIYDGIELHCFRNQVNAIVMKDGGIFTEVELHENND